ncbi:Ig-like domain-containing protein [Pseudomonas sp. TWP3-1]|uniref:Ig-like domain-containing protein n=1 Tax=Pseudomonas sp. TWP3-1 TaxID=2804631 RepID=UPI003CE82DAA
MIQIMVMPIAEDIDDAQVDVLCFPATGVFGSSALNPPYIPGQFENIDFEPAQVGVNGPMLHVSAAGLLVLVQAYLNMDQGDSIRLYVGSNLVASTVLPLDHGNRDIGLRIRADKLYPGVHLLRYEIARKSGQLPEGAQMYVWSKPQPPGGIDPEPDNPGHQGLPPAQLQLPPGKVIDKEVAEQGVTASILPWFDMTQGDVLSLFFHGVLIQHTVLKSEVGKPVDVFITPQHIADAGPANPAVLVYQLRDQVENFSSFSERTTVVSDPGVNWLDPVFVPLANEKDQVGLDEVGFDELAVEIVTRPGFALREKLLLRWLATTENGEVVEHSEEQPITRLGIQSFKIPNEIVRVSADSMVRLDYLRTRTDGTQDPAERYFLRVLGESLRLAAPRMPQLIGGFLDSSLTQAVVECGPDARIKKGFRVTLSWVGKTASGREHLYQTFRNVSDRLVGKVIPFNIAAKDIGLLKHGSVAICFEVSDPSLNPALVSGTLLARVDDLDATLPGLTVDGVVAGVLKPADVPYGTDIRIPAASDTRLGDVVHVEGRGDNNDVVYRDRLLINHGKEGKNLDFWLDDHAIERYLNQFFSLLWWIERAGALPQSSSALELFIGDPKLALQAPRVWRALRGILNPLENNQGAVAWVHLADPRPGTKVLLRVKGTAGAGSPVFVPQSLDVDNRAGFTLSPEFVAENLGRKVVIDYDVLGGVRPITSPALELTVLKIADQDAGLVKPVIVEAGGTQFIDLRTMSSDLTCSIPLPLPIAVVGQKVWIEISDSKGAALRVRDGVALNDAEISKGITAKADLKWFAALDDLSRCELTCKIALRSTDTEATALILPLTSYTVKVTPALAIEGSEMLLDGLKVVGGSAYGLQEREVPRNTATRIPTGGREPYTYRVANPALATVDSLGKVKGLKNGLTKIMVTDGAGAQVSYPVRILNVYWLLLNDAYMTPPEARNWLKSVGATEIYNGAGVPLGFNLPTQNFIDVYPLFGGRGLAYGRFFSSNLTYPDLYVIETSLTVNGGLGAGNHSLTESIRKRAMAYIAT